ncbi:hypothetical protein TNCV_3109691 [Trichonephila clavipes]|nr:hypothetical protein TNCV_3109691 [Trichonephila clavipes]
MCIQNCNDDSHAWYDIPEEVVSKNIYLEFTYKLKPLKGFDLKVSYTRKYPLYKKDLHGGLKKVRWWNIPNKHQFLFLFFYLSITHAEIESEVQGAARSHKKPSLVSSISFQLQDGVIFVPSTGTDFTAHHPIKLHVKKLCLCQPVQQSLVRLNDDIPSPDFAPLQQQQHFEQFVALQNAGYSIDFDID